MPMDEAGGDAMQRLSSQPTPKFLAAALSGEPLSAQASAEGQTMRVAVVHPDAAVAARLCASLNAHRHRVEVFSQAHGLVSAVESGDDIGVAFLGAADLVMVRAQIGDRVTLLVQVGGNPDPAADASLPARYTAAELRTCLTLLEKMHRLSAAERLLEERVDALRQALSLDLDLPLLTLTQITQRMLRLESLGPSVRTEVEAIAGAAAGARERLDVLRSADGGEAVALPEPQLRPVSARSVVNDILPLAGVHPTAVHWEPEEGDPVVRVDPGFFQQALGLLLGDARRRTEGTGRLSFTVTSDMMLRVELAGVQSPTEPTMAACEAILATHHGRAEVVYTRGAGQGPVVRLTWPRVVEVRPAELAPVSTPLPEERLSIWMVDDETMVRRATERLLTHLRHDVRLFDRGSELVEALPDASRAPDLILADNDLPGMSGLEVLRRVRTLSPAAARVLYTAHAPGPAVVDAFNHGTVQRCVHKSDGIPALEAILRQVLAERKSDGRVTAQAEEDRVRLDLDDLITQRRLTLFVQPLYDATTGAWVACEALMRSRHPAFKGPMDILDAAHHFDRQLELQRVLAIMSRDIRDQLPPEVSLFVNVDPGVLRSVKRLDETLSALYPVSRGVVLELTERARLSQEPGWEMVVQRMRDLGFRVALDDVGAGYNSLGAVAAVQPEVIKIDISLISGVHQDARKAELVRILCDYAARYDLLTVAEGIEQAEEAATCQALGVRWLQGFHLGRPMPLEQLRARAA
jgi:EAL domain-containing protein (putative c-di-GMP-specific phosphodiesterase class I)/CheY-like chemotaxis protein